ncbi:hypothetical protein LCGC14_1470250 [marine sediment metagenome]|uniref:DNA (cytosine-5-)-methyltransferase n=1 Tax=marine sediment metagenome TaxID=412755 RepID=A0A0F9LT04_9ZZZZ
MLSLFPGIGLLDMAFEEEGFTVVRGPDVLWGGDVKRFHPPAGKFDGVIGGPPCQEFSSLAPLVRHNGHEPRFGNLIPEYERCVFEAQPRWFVMENVRGAPLPNVEGYDRWAELLKDSDIGGVQPRVRRISLGLREGEWTSIASPFTLVEYASAEERCPRCGGTRVEWDARGLWCRDCEHIWLPLAPTERTITTNSAGGSFGDTRRDPDSGRPDRRKRSIVGDARVTPIGARVRKDDGGGELPHIGASLSVADVLEAQGLPRDYLDDAPFTMDGKRKAIGNGVPLPMGRAIARAVKRVLA